MGFPVRQSNAPTTRPGSQPDSADRSGRVISHRCVSTGAGAAGASAEAAYAAITRAGSACTIGAAGLACITLIAASLGHVGQVTNELEGWRLRVEHRHHVRLGRVRLAG